jgi:cardiolipin synthase
MRPTQAASYSRILAVPTLCLLAACSSPDIVPPLGEEIPGEPVLEALDAYRGNDQYFLRYRQGSEIYYAAGDLKGYGAAARERAAPPQRFTDPLVVPLQQGEPDPWQALARDLTPIPVLDIEEWATLRDLLFADFLPRQSNQGVAVSLDRMDYFFFIDRAGNFRSRRLIDKPQWYEVSRHVDLARYFEQWQPQLRDFLRQRGFEAGEVLFNTGDLEEGAFPFIYVNAQDKLIVLIRFDRVPDSISKNVPGAHILQSLWHFIESHTYSVPMRPFSSAQSLMSVISDTALESGRTLFTTGLPEGPPPPLAAGPLMDLVAWEAELDDLLQRPASRGKLRFLVDGEAFFTRFIDAAASATESIDVRAYIFDNDDVALGIAELLKRRSREGVDVRVLFDGLGTIIAGGERSGSLPPGHEAPISISSYLKQDSRIGVRTVKNTWLAGDHVKTMIIDRRLAFLGGMNIGREYRYDWHDLMVEVSGPVVDEINDEFNRAWRKAGWLGDFGVAFGWGDNGVNQSTDGDPLRLIYTRPGKQEIYSAQRKAIQRARSYIFIENAYFTDDILLRELIAARHRGVDVRVIIPLETDRGLITRNIALAANTMLAHGIRVYLYPGFTHAKAAVFDGWASLGTANLDRLSLKINEEINIATSHPEAVAQLLATLFEPDFARSTELTEPFPERWYDHLIEIFGDYLF